MRSLETRLWGDPGSGSLTKPLTCRTLTDASGRKRRSLPRARDPSGAEAGAPDFPPPPPPSPRLVCLHLWRLVKRVTAYGRGTGLRGKEKPGGAGGPRVPAMGVAVLGVSSKGRAWAAGMTPQPPPGASCNRLSLSASGCLRTFKWLSSAAGAPRACITEVSFGHRGPPSARGPWDPKDWGATSCGWASAWDLTATSQPRSSLRTQAGAWSRLRPFHSLELAAVPVPPGQPPGGPRACACSLLAPRGPPATGTRDGASLLGPSLAGPGFQLPRHVPCLRAPLFRGMMTYAYFYLQTRNFIFQ